MRFCDFCGEEILGTPYRRKRHHYCSRSCADEHEFELVEEEEQEEDTEVDFEEEEDER
jgi:hypothetical protein